MFSGKVSYVSRNQGYSRSTSRLRGMGQLQARSHGDGRSAVGGFSGVTRPVARASAVRPYSRICMTAAIARCRRLWRSPAEAVGGILTGIYVQQMPAHLLSSSVHSRYSQCGYTFLQDACRERLAAFSGA